MDIELPNLPILQTTARIMIDFFFFSTNDTFV